jgi:hypothetical protein
MCKKILITFFITTMIICVYCYGEKIGAGAVYNPGTGDAALDATLGNINLRTHGSTLDEFIANISATYNLPKARIDILINTEKLTPADVYMAAGISKIIKCPFDTVIEEYKKSNGKGWGTVAKRLGIKPGSKEFHELKKDGSNYLSEGKKQNKNNVKGKKKNKKLKQKDDRQKINLDNENQI